MAGAALVAFLLLGAAAQEGERVPIPIEPIPPFSGRIDLLDKCLTPTEGDDIVVCGGSGRGERYRLRGGGHVYTEPPVESVSRERHRLMEGGEAGIGSCSNIGPGGMTGCLARDLRRRAQQDAGR